VPLGAGAAAGFFDRDWIEVGTRVIREDVGATVEFAADSVFWLEPYLLSGSGWGAPPEA
jgi:hypothetical protein